jgi:tetratricopeptide (TPR) repeat protein
MDSLVSAIAARVVFIEGNEARFVEADAPAHENPIALSAIPYVLADAYDTVKLKNTTAPQSFQLLLSSWNADRALRMLDIMLDADSPEEEAQQAAGYFADLIADQETAVRVKNVALAIPLATQLEERIPKRLQGLGAALSFVEKLLAIQDNIAKVRTAWEQIPDFQFEHRAEFEAAAISQGAFRKLVEALGDSAAVNGAVLDCYLALRDQGNARSVISDWTKQFVERQVRRKLRRVEEATDDEQDDDEEVNRYVGRIHQTYTDTRKQQEGIIIQLERGNVNLAKKFTDQLVQWQLRNGGAEFAAMSLCLLAQEAKRLGHGSLQLEWVQRAVELAPEDAQAHGQAGDAYLSLLRLDEADREYSTSISLGDNFFGLSGLARVLRERGKLDDALASCVETKKRFSDHPEIYRLWALECEILRDMWRLEEALASYRRAEDRFPEQAILWSGVASVLKDMGRLQEAFESFTLVVDKFPDEGVPRGGRADTLKLLGRLDEALREYETAISLFPHNAYLFTGRADVLRAFGRYEEAATAYRTAIRDFPFEPIAYCGYGDTLRDAGDVEGALRAYDQALTRFPSDQRCRTGHANVLRYAGRFEEALQAIDRNVRDFPYDLYSLTGRANLLKLLGHHRQAIEAYQMIIDRRPDYESAKYGKAAVHVALRQFDEADRLLPKGKPTSLSEWVGFHIRGMMHLKKGEVDAAIKIFEEGMRDNPFHRQRAVLRDLACRSENST